MSGFLPAFWLGIGVELDVVNNNDNNSNSLFELSQPLLTNITILPARVAYEQRYKL